MDVFLADIEKRAYQMTILATSSHADALDLLQDTMIKVVTKYQSKPQNEWKPLFYKILQNRIRDWHRHQKVRSMLCFWKTDEEEMWQGSSLDSGYREEPEYNVVNSQKQQAALKNLQSLSMKQQQCFLLRSWEGMSVAQTADIMNCSQGSVKTHYSSLLFYLRMIVVKYDLTNQSLISY